MYIPQSHYSLNTSAKLPLIVNVHGSLRRAERARDSLIDLADQVGAAILAPLFPAGVGDPNDSHGYKFLKCGDLRYDLILLSMVDEVKLRWPGIETDKFYLVGFSGGGQFVSRFFYLHPDRLRGVSVGAPGTVTSLDRSLKWPRGLKDVKEQFDGLLVDVDALKSVRHVQLAVGGDDVEPPGGGLLKWYAEQKNGDRIVERTVGKSLSNRTEALARLRDELRDAGLEVRYDVVPGVGHEVQKVLPTVIQFLQDVLSSSRY